MTGTWRGFRHEQDVNTSKLEARPVREGRELGAGGRGSVAW